jgi:serine/threonine protein kinase
MTQAAQTETLQPGTRLHHNRYEIEHVLGRGGFGITYRARDHKTGERVALKELFPDGNATRDSSGQVALVSGSEDDFLRLRVTFEAEADLLASLRSQAIVAVIEFFEENQTAYLVMEYLEGETLEERIARQPLNDTEARDILGTLLEALEEVHNLGVLHRDIKPANIVLSTHGPELIDFGTAMKGIGREVKVVDRILTPAYAPLEQYAGESKFGPPTDLYALAATFYEAVTGVRPPSALERSRGVPLKPIRVIVPQISKSLAETLESALELRVDQRPKSARFMLGQVNTDISDLNVIASNRISNSPKIIQVSWQQILALMLITGAFSFFSWASWKVNYKPEATGFFLMIACLSLYWLISILVGLVQKSTQFGGNTTSLPENFFQKIPDGTQTKSNTVSTSQKPSILFKLGSEDILALIIFFAIAILPLTVVLVSIYDQADPGVTVSAFVMFGISLVLLVVWFAFRDKP